MRVQSVDIIYINVYGAVCFSVHSGVVRDVRLCMRYNVLGENVFVCLTNVNAILTVLYLFLV